MHGARSSIVVSVLILCISVGFSGYIVFSEQKVLSSVESDTRHRPYSSNPLLYAITATSTYKQKYADTVFGGIVSHHLLANIDISNFFAEFADQKVDRVVIIGPNHYYPNAFPFLSTTRNYATPFGDIDVDAKMITKLVESKLVELSPDILEEEHAVSSLVPYVSAYFPHAEIVPIIVSARASEMELEKLSDHLAKVADANTVVVASVDFSHHLYSNASQIHDARSVAAIQNFDYKSLFTLEVDSQGSLYILLKYLDSKGAKNIALQQQNSARIFNAYDSEDVTSYVFAHAQKGNLERSTGASILFLGDTMLGRGIAQKNALFENIRGPEGNFLKGYDAVVVNLEGAIGRENCDEKNDELLIAPDDLRLLSKNRITHVGAMNNHFGRCPHDAQVKKIFDAAELTPIDDSGTTISGTNIDVEIVSFFASPVPQDMRPMLDRVRRASADGKIVVVSMHWGIEYDTEPSLREKELARVLVDAGASVIIGHHPHVVQPIERYKNGFIFYSLGNFISDQIGQETKIGFAVGLFVTSQYVQATVFPFTQQDGRPVHFEQSTARGFCESLYQSGARSEDHPCVITVSR